MEGKKVIVDFSETEEVVLGPDSELEELKVTGAVSVINPSENSRIWNAKLHLSNVQNLDIPSGEYTVGEVEPGGRWSREYKVNVSEPVLHVKEVIDTWAKEEGVTHQAFCRGKEMPVSITITLKNQTAMPVFNVRLEKKLPDGFEEPEIKAMKGNVTYEVDTRKIIWEIPQMDPEAELLMLINTKTLREDGNPVGMGEIIVTYELKGNCRAIADAHLESIGRSMTMINIEESEKGPGFWECALQFHNRSDMIYLVRKAVVTMQDQKIVEVEPNAEVAPNDKWIHKFTVEGLESPKLDKVVDFIVVYDIHRSLKGTIRKKEKVLPVVDVKCEKRFEPPSVPAYQVTPLTAILILENIGSAVIDSAEFSDLIPKHFVPPQPEDIKVEVDGRSVEDGIEVLLEPSEVTAETEHKMLVKVTDLIDRVGGLKPGGKLVVSYQFRAMRPLPTMEYPAPLKVTGYAKPAGPGADAETPEGEPKIGITYVKRRYTCGKSYEPGAAAGEFIITILLSNTGEVPLEDIEVKDVIPRGFEVVEWTPKTAEVETREEEGVLYLVWKVPRVPAGQQVELEYKVKGTGEYVSKEPIVTIHGERRVEET
ncbi:MAG: hypothetical protein ACTSXJ_06355 [Candidatus Baldrarchaeia archaeon]